MKCKNKVHQSYDAQKERALERKLYFVESMGGECSHCGYCGNLAALSFHHKGGKEYQLDSRSLSNRGISEVRKEIAKCELLCANCHMELHHSHLDVAKLSIEPTALTTELQARKSRGRSTARDASLIIAKNDAFVNKFMENLAHCGVKSGQTLVLGVSGGVDSITMLDLFAKTEMKLKLIVAHMNHGIRREAFLDEELVRNQAQNHGFKYISKTIQPPKTGNLEEELREKRRGFLLSVASNNNADFVALAHNANDQAETLILNLLRGSGPAGLGGMSMSEGGLIRPLLNVSRDEIETYAKANNLAWHEDITNQDTRLRRNFVRHRLLPMFEHLNPDYLSAIHRTAYLQRKIDDHFKEEAWHIIRNVKDKTQKVSAEKLKRLDKPLLYEVFGLLYEEVKGDRKNLSLKHLSSLEEMIADARGSKELDLPGNIVARRRYDKLDFCAKKEHNTPSAPRTKKLRLGAQLFGDWKVTVKMTNHSLPTTRSELIVDAETFKELTVRTRRPGDTIYKKGLGGKKKLQDLFVDAKIDRADRESYPIIVNRQTEEILWVPLLAKSEYKPKNETDKYQITVEEVPHEAKKD